MSFDSNVWEFQIEHEDTPLNGHVIPYFLHVKALNDDSIGVSMLKPISA